MSQNLRQRFNLWKFHTKLYLAGIYFTLFEKTYKVDGLDLVIPFDMTDIKFRGQFPINFYERQERRYLRQYLPESATVLELGACLGVVSCITNKLLKNPGQHVVVEANPAVIPVIRENKMRNNCGFQIENCMLSNQKENEFFIGKSLLTSSILREGVSKINVPGKTLQDLETAYGLTFDVLMMDIEGGELYFLRENRSRLSQFKVIFMEVHEHKDVLTAAEVAECLTILNDSGFEKIVDDTSFWVLTKRS